MENLVIVESPNKCKSIQSYLGAGWKVMASFGHVRQLLRKKSSGVSVDDSFKLNFMVEEKKQEQVDKIIKAAKQAKCIWLASDPDREGEAIAWHVAELIKEAGVKAKIVRITFNEITKSAVQEAVKQPRDIDMNLVNAQQARQGIDYLVGFNLSPLLWKKVCSGTSAGRVQSSGLRMVDERDDEIKSFVPEAYWKVYLYTQHDKIAFRAQLYEEAGVKLGNMDIKSQEHADQIVKTCKGKPVKVLSVKERRVNRRPYPPFKTSTLQQDAASKLHWAASKTMQVAQNLFESVKGFDGGLITYMRTDSVNLSQEAINAIRAFIPRGFGAEALPDKPNFFANKAKNAQEAHEAIRPVNVNIRPEDVKGRVDDDLYKLYKLIWSRAVASQMVDAVYDRTTVQLEAGTGKFRATGSKVVYAGWMAAYDAAKGGEEEDEENMRLPQLSEGLDLPNEKVEASRHETKPPAHFNEASLVKNLEEKGIGRPSTYASILRTLKEREYVNSQSRRFEITDRGHLVSKYLRESFPTYVDYEYTAKLEEQLDDIAKGERSYLDVMNAFWGPFQAAVTEAKKHVEEGKGVVEVLEEICPECGQHPLAVKISRYGKYVACTGYPTCTYLRKDKDASIGQAEPTGEKCPECQSDLVKKKSRRGDEFVGCSAYPVCKYIQRETFGTCPQCGKHDLVKKRGKWGPMICCSGYPECKYIEKKKKD